MRAIKFNLSGQTAFFKKTDVNQNVYFTYSHIHKIALLGIIGSIIGLDGYSKQYARATQHPEFYEKLKNIKISIVPQGGNNGYFHKKIIIFNNTTGFASKEKGGALNIREQWLLDVNWDIYILDDSSEMYKEIEDYLINKKSVYIPYLGKNDHYANISNVQIVNLTETNNVSYIHSLYISENDDIVVDKDSITHDEEEVSRYFEYLPYELDSNNLYKFKLFTFTNLSLKINNNNNKIYNYNNNNLMFI